jgi:hypothetical protein
MVTQATEQGDGKDGISAITTGSLGKRNRSLVSCDRVTFGAAATTALATAIWNIARVICVS